MTPTDQRPQNCKHYRNGQCTEVPCRNDGIAYYPHKCCMRIVEPMIECFYFTPKNPETMTEKK